MPRGMAAEARASCRTKLYKGESYKAVCPDPSLEKRVPVNMASIRARV